MKNCIQYLVPLVSSLYECYCSIIFSATKVQRIGWFIWAIKVEEKKPAFNLARVLEKIRIILCPAATIIEQSDHWLRKLNYFIDVTNWKDTKLTNEPTCLKLGSDILIAGPFHCSKFKAGTAINMLIIRDNDKKWQLRGRKCFLNYTILVNE